MKNKSTTMKAARKGPHATPLGSYLSITAGAGAASLLGANGAVVYYNGAAVTVSTLGSILYWDPIHLTAGVSGSGVDRFQIKNTDTDYVYTIKNESSIKMFLGVTALGGNVPAKLGAGATIDASTFWFGDTWAYMDRTGWTTAQSPWATGQDGTTGNIPFMFYPVGTSGQKYYGWADITYNDVSNSITLNNFAYNNTPNAAVTAGAIPEPSSMLLLAMGGTTVLAARRRRKDNLASVAVAS
jgi:hypothetical protein